MGGPGVGGLSALRLLAACLERRLPDAISVGIRAALKKLRAQWAEGDGEAEAAEEEAAEEAGAEEGTERGE